MEQISLGDIATWTAFIAALCGSVATIVKLLKNALKTLFTEQMADIDKRLSKHEETIAKIDMENCKNFLVSYLVKVEHDGFTDEIESQRFWEEFEHYKKLGGNSYIRNKVEKLVKDGKL